MLNTCLGALTRPLVASLSLAAAVALVSQARADVHVDMLSSTVQNNFDGNIVATDLINNGSLFLSGAPATTGSVATYGGDVAPLNDFDHLTDGTASSKVTNNDISHDTYFDGGSFGTNPSITYNFDTTASPLGYSLTQVRSINGWADSTGFSHQKYTVSVALVGSPAMFTPLQSVDYDPFPGNGGSANSSQVTLTGDTTPALATGVASVRFAFENNGNGQVFREIDVLGTPTVVPEPASLSLLAVGGALLTRRRFRR